MAKKVLEKPLAVTMGQACELLGVSPNFLRKLMSEGRIKAVRLNNRRTLIPMAELEQLLSKSS